MRRRQLVWGVGRAFRPGLRQRVRLESRTYIGGRSYERSRESFYEAYFKHLPNQLTSPFYWRPRVPLLPEAETDADGRFRLPGFAKEQLVELRIEGPAMQTQNLYVMTRPASREGGEPRSLTVAARMRLRVAGKPSLIDARANV
jgi:hypothetical protein